MSVPQVTDAVAVAVADEGEGTVPAFPGNEPLVSAEQVDLHPDGHDGAHGPPQQVGSRRVTNGVAYLPSVATWLSWRVCRLS